MTTPPRPRRPFTSQDLLGSVRLTSTPLGAFVVVDPAAPFGSAGIVESTSPDDADVIDVAFREVPGDDADPDGIGPATGAGPGRAAGPPASLAERIARALSSRRASATPSPEAAEISRLVTEFRTETHDKLRRELREQRADTPPGDTGAQPAATSGNRSDEGAGTSASPDVGLTVDPIADPGATPSADPMAHRGSFPSNTTTAHTSDKCDAVIDRLLTAVGTNDIREWIGTRIRSDELQRKRLASLLQRIDLAVCHEETKVILFLALAVHDIAFRNMPERATDHRTTSPGDVLIRPTCDLPGQPDEEAGTPGPTGPG